MNGLSDDMAVVCKERDEALARVKDLEAQLREASAEVPGAVEELTQACTNCGLLYGCTCVPCRLTIDEPSDAGKENAHG